MKINLASGQRPFEKPWVNIDIKEQGHPVDIITDAKDLNMIKDGEVDIIVAHHLVEHIAIHELNSFLTEWRRVLKTGGILSVFVPNLLSINKAWIEGRITTFIHNVNTYGAYQDSIHDLHKWGYDERELDDRMHGADDKGYPTFAWTKTRNYSPDDSLYEGADIAQDWWILCREYIK